MCVYVQVSLGVYILGKRVYQCDKEKVVERHLEQKSNPNGGRTEIECKQQITLGWWGRVSECNGCIFLPLHTRNPGTRQWSLQAAIHG